MNTLQLVIVQCCGLIIFYLLSTRLEKNEFGEMNWALAVLMTAFGILALGIDQIAVKRIASGASPSDLLPVYLNHLFITGVSFYLLLWTCSFLFPVYFSGHTALLLLGAGKLMIFFSTAFKQVATGMEKFRPLLLMAISSNVLRALILTVTAFWQQPDFGFILIIFVTTDLAELLVCIFITHRILRVPVKLKWDKPMYSGLLREALPQFGVAVFTAALARLDWIFLGILSTPVILAEYSFAYKVFEMATLPLLVTGPVLIPRFTKYFHPAATDLAAAKMKELYMLLRWEMIIASFIVLLLNIAWTPLVDMLTDNKYGAVNQTSIWLLSLSMPFLYFNNFLWTVNFAKGRLRMVFYVFLTSFIINAAADIILIPLWKAEGAAIAYLLAIFIQSVLYLKNTELPRLAGNSYAVLLCPLAAVASFLLIKNVSGIIWINLLAAPLLYLLLLFATGQIRRSDWYSLRRIAGL